ncbi:AarF/UbiB family protein [Actinoalloteichus sp. AHMU CJ021]|uniref:AarF/UbiB family protein n=1 Tax=Actinoalloteichus sp. AHMU CJ021 TaxID=2072503 RepID=UPI003FCC5790
MLSLFNFSAPHQVGLLHADPHPGNFMLDGDGRLIVIDFGAVARLPGGPPPTFGVLLRLALGDDPDELLRFLRAERFLGPRTELAAEDVLAFRSCCSEPRPSRPSTRPACAARSAPRPLGCRSGCPVRRSRSRWGSASAGARSPCRSGRTPRRVPGEPAPGCSGSRCRASPWPTSAWDVRGAT